MVYMPPRKRKSPTINRTARLAEDVAMMLDLYAEDQQWSGNTALETALRRYLEGLGYKEKVEALLKEQNED
jgi:predicted HicB family RNase H-like nuclease